MKQKIIFTTIFALICLILLIISPENIFGIITCGDCTLYGPPICEIINGKQQCWKDCIEEAACDDNSGFGPGTSPDSGPGSVFPDDTEDGWNCLDDGRCVFVRNQKRVDYSTEAECLARCQSRGTYNKCRTPLPGSWAWLTGNRDTLYCKPASWTGTRPTDECQKDSDCGKPVSIPSSISCSVCVGEKCQSKSFNVSSCSQVTGYTLCSSDSQCKTSTTPTSSIQCNVCIGEKCQSKSFNLSSCSRITNYTRCSSNQDCKGTPPPPPPPLSPTCFINKFELPNHVWTGVDYEAKWSTSNDCRWGEITCTLGDEDCGDNENLSGEVTVGSIDHEKSFHITTPGVYTYQLKACYDKNNEDTCDIWEDTLGTGLDYIEVQAVNLPWWQEIIPVLPDKLQGFLRGLIS